MPVHNLDDFLVEAIDSVLAQTFRDFELIVVDDGSTDNSTEITKEYARRDRRVTVLRFERRRGQEHARNRALAEANGDYIAVMDSDDIAMPIRLEKQIAFLEANPAIGMVGGNLQRIDSDSKPIHVGVAGVPLPHALIALWFIIGNAINHPTIMIRRELMDLVGGYDPDYRKGSDRDLFIRLLGQHKIRIVNLPDILIHYRQHERQVSARQDRASPAKSLLTRLRLLEELGCPQSAETFERLSGLQVGPKLPWAERRAVKRELRWLIPAMLRHNLVDDADEPLLIAEMNRLLEEASPRLWQKFCHWRRYRLPWLFPARMSANPSPPKRD